MSKTIRVQANLFIKLIPQYEKCVTLIVVFVVFVVFVVVVVFVVFVIFVILKRTY